MGLWEKAYRFNRFTPTFVQRVMDISGWYSGTRRTGIFTIYNTRTLCKSVYYWRVCWGALKNECIERKRAGQASARTRLDKALLV